MYEYIIFDLDGTITDPFEGITNGVVHALEHFGITVEDKRTLIPFIGPPLRESFMEYYGFSEEQAAVAIEKYREVFSVTGWAENKLLDGTISLLETLKKSGKHILLATGKPEVFARKILKKFDIEKYFDFIGGASLDKTRSDKESVLRYDIKEYGITDISKAVMVGDRMHDVQGAEAVGMDTIGVLVGYGSREELENSGAKYIAETLDEVLKYV